MVGLRLAVAVLRLAVAVDLMRLAVAVLQKVCSRGWTEACYTFATEHSEANPIRDFLLHYSQTRGAPQ